MIVSMTLPIAFIKDLVYLESNRINKKILEEEFFCEYQHPHSEEITQYWFARQQVINEKLMIGVARGDNQAIQRLCHGINELQVYDFTNKTPFQSTLQFNGKLYPEQQQAVDTLLQHQRGILKSPPRTGKTVMSVNLICRLKLKTLIIAHQDDLLRQWVATFQGNKDKPAFTNAKELNQANPDNPCVVFVKKNSDFFLNADVIVTTYQKFIRELGLKTLHEIKDRFGCVIVDEVHRANADVYANRLSYFSPNRFYGVSATPDRKDEKEFVMRKWLGPIVHQIKPAMVETNTATGNIKVFKPTVEVYRSKLSEISRKRDYAVIRQLCESKSRTQDLVRHALYDIQEGYHIIIPSLRKKYCEELAESINFAYQQHTGDSTAIIAAAFYSDKQENKEEKLAKARTGELKVIIAIRSMLEGIDVPAWSMIYEIFPISNLPAFTQESMRICTFRADKKLPVMIKIFLDEGMNKDYLFCDYCFLNTVKHCKELNYKLTDNAEAWYTYIKQKVRKLHAPDPKEKFNALVNMFKRNQS